MKLALISGVAGQDGAFLSAHLLDKGYNVVGLVRGEPETDLFRLGYLGIKHKITLKKTDLLNREAVTTVLDEYRPDEFYNLAALSSVGYSFHNPYTSFDFNTRSVINILEGIRKVSPKTRYYQASSSEMFGNIGKDRLPVKETFLFHPVSPYGISKASAHWLTVNYREAYGVEACCGILFNHESALRPKNFVIKKIVRAAIEIKEKGEGQLILGNTAVTRDWGYAPYYVDAMWRMLQQDKLDDYLICSGDPVVLNDFVSAVFQILDLESEDYVSVDRGLLRSLDLEIIYGDNSKAKKELGWNYELTSKDLIKLLIADEYKLRDWEGRQ